MRHDAHGFYKGTHGMVNFIVHEYKNTRVICKSCKISYYVEGCRKARYLFERSLISTCP